uniref:Flp pilus assembly protein TadB n=1 Tax=Aeromonas sp. Ne-1 TaxID=1675689 RepID=A0A0H4JD04_9GAMM|nr:hypothetical protein [Aeromonas sp. Ne-1]AKO69657.1 hypothetical protein [Aeromonas sp. Ne-1]
MYTLIQILVKIIGFSFFLWGLWLLIGSPYLKKEIQSSFRNSQRKRRLRRFNELNNINDKKKESNQLYKHIELLLNSLSKKEKSPVNFFVLTLLIFLVTFIVLINVVSDVVISSIIALAFAMLPYMLLRFRLITFRLKTQMAFMNEFHNVLQNYQSTGKDIYYMVLNVSKDTEDKNLKYIYMKLLSSLQKDRGEKQFLEAITLFSYSINSTFSKRFAKLLIKGYMERVDISRTLVTMNHDIKRRQQDLDTEKTNKVETILMGYFPALLFPLMVFAAYKVAGVRDFWYYFQQKTVLTVFIIALICSVISVLTAYVTSKPRADV